MPEGLPPASDKLRTVLDYVPCEACLSQRVAEQELLCSICHRLDREVGVRIAVHTTVLIDRPSAAAPAAPVVIPPPGVAPQAAAALPVVRVRFIEPGAKPKKEKGAPPGVVDVFVEPIPEAAPAAAAAAPPVAAPVDGDAGWEDVVDYEPPVDAFEYTGPAVVPREEPAPVVVAQPAAAEAVPEDDFVFRPPPQEDEVPAASEATVASEELDDAWLPTEEVPVRSESEEASSPWSRPAEAAEAVPAEVPILEEAPPAQAEAEEEPILEATLVEDDEDVVETEIVEDAPPEPAAPQGASDLWRLRGFDARAEKALAGANIAELAHLSGHDATELAERTGLDARRLTAWIDVADLKEEVGVPLDAALALVAAGIAGPRGLRDSDPEEIVDKVAAFGGSTVQLKDVKRWKRRA